MNRAKIKSRYTVDVVDIEQQQSLIEFKYSQAVSRITSTGEERVTAINIIEQERTAALEALDSYLPFEESEPPTVGNTDIAIPYYELTEGVVHQLWEVEHNNPTLVAAQTTALKSKLAESDYQVLKCYEASLLDQPMPYDIATITAERQALRDEIDKLYIL
ncbi:MAG: hypothetical protein SNI32_06305 [Rikenellaceae bacterium]